MKKSIPGFPRYMITEEGDLWDNRTERYVIPFTRKRTSKGRSSCFAANLYREDGHRVRVPIHRLVWKAFIGPVPRYIGFKDGDSFNPRLDNLYHKSPTLGNTYGERDSAEIRKDDSFDLEEAMRLAKEYR